ncbi:hypothetical protein P9112_006399 [Eukaryota sp. TZLM1-RC]
MLLTYSFNALGTCLGVGTSEGVFECYNCDGKAWRGALLSRNVQSGIRIVELLFHSSSLFLVGDFPKDNATSLSQWAPNKLRIWSDSQRFIVGELKFDSPITNVKVNSSILVISLSDTIYIYRLSDLVLIESFPCYSAPLPRGTTSLPTTSPLAVSPTQDPCEPSVLACLGESAGEMRLVYVSAKDGTVISVLSHQAHKHPIETICLAHCGDYVATAGQKGTLIRLFKISDQHKPTLIWQFRRGLKPKQISSMAFSHSLDLLAVVSTFGTIHLFDIRDAVESANNIVVSDETVNVDCTRSVFQYSLSQDTRPVLSFGNNDEVLNVAMNNGVFQQFDVIKQRSVSDFVRLVPGTTGRFYGD